MNFLKSDAKNKAFVFYNVLLMMVKSNKYNKQRLEDDHQRLSYIFLIDTEAVLTNIKLVD